MSSANIVSAALSGSKLSNVSASSAARAEVRQTRSQYLNLPGADNKKDRSVARRKTSLILYCASILSRLKKKDLALASSLMRRFRDNLLAGKSFNKSSLKSALHESLNQLVRTGELGIGEVKNITHAAWKEIYHDSVISRNENSRQIAATGLQLRRTEQVSDLPAGFLWKPVADSPPHGLAILLPADWTGSVAALQIMDPERRNVIATGRDGGVGNGNRQHYRFDRQGAEFPDGVIVRVIFKDGSAREIEVAQTAARTEGKD